MCRWIAYRGDPIFLEDLILKPNNSLIEQSLECLEGKARTNGDGFGIGWYGLKTEPGVFREVLPAWNDPNLRALAEQINSHLFFAHVRASTGTETARLNCHPFSYGRWLFMHNGQISNYETCRRKLETLVNDDLYGHRRGSTDSELMFLLMVQNGLEDDPHGAIRKTIEQVTEATERECGEATLKMTICLSDGNQLYACRHATTGAPPTLYWQLLGSDLLIALRTHGRRSRSLDPGRPGRHRHGRQRLHDRPAVPGRKPGSGDRYGNRTPAARPPHFPRLRPHRKVFGSAAALENGAPTGSIGQIPASPQ